MYFRTKVLSYAKVLQHKYTYTIQELQLQYDTLCNHTVVLSYTVHSYTLMSPDTFTFLEGSDP